MEKYRKFFRVLVFSLFVIVHKMRGKKEREQVSSAGLINQFTSVVAPAALGRVNRGAASAKNTLFRQLGGLLGISSALATLFALWKVSTHFSVLGLNQIQRDDFANGAQPVYATSFVVVLGMALLSSRVHKFEILTDN